MMYILIIVLLFNLTSISCTDILHNIGIEPPIIEPPNSVKNKSENKLPTDVVQLQDDPFSSGQHTITEHKPSQKVEDNNTGNVNKQISEVKKTEDLDTKVKDIKDSAVDKNSAFKPISPHIQGEVQSGAILRGFYVFLGLSTIIMIYLVVRSYRLRRGSQPSTTVRKYGITARRSDIEMRPLELEDEDDDTLFEIGNHNSNR